MVFKRELLTGLIQCILLLVHTSDCADPKITIKQTFPATTVVNGRKTVTVQKNSDCFLACVSSNKPKGKYVHWVIQNYDTHTVIPVSSHTDTQQTFKYQIDKPSSNNFRLKIKNLQPSDQALYICLVQLGAQQTANDSRVISVVETPRIVDIMTSSDTVAEEGDQVKLTCGASGIPAPVLSWQLVGGGTLPTGGRELHFPTLSIDSVSRHHRGYYKCVAQNVAGKDSRRIYLDVKFPPKVVQKSREVYQAVGYSKELHCEASGSPVPTANQILWYRDGVPLEDANKYSFKYFYGSNYVLMKLVINDVTESDYGEYRCYAENSQGNGQNFVRLSRSQIYVGDFPRKNSASAVLSARITCLYGIIMHTLLFSY